ETGPEGRQVETAVVARVHEAGAILLGPNCLGLLDVGAELYLTSNGLPAGSIGLISQSGNLALELGEKAAQARLGFSRFASTGNQADLDVADLITSFATSDAVEVIAVYCEDFRDGRRFLEAASSCWDLGKPVVLLTAGTSQAGARAARSHTGAIASGARSIDAACLAVGIERVSTPQQMIDVIEGLLLGSAATGRRVGVLADGGGHGALAADVVETTGLSVPAFSDELAARLARAIATTGGTDNPIDLAGGGEQDIWSFERALRELLGSSEVDAVLLTGYFGAYSNYGAELAEAEREVAEALARSIRGSPKPVVVHSMHPLVGEVGEGADFLAGAEPLLRLRSAGVPVYSDVEAAASVLARLVRRALDPPTGLPDLPAPTPGPVAEGYWAARSLLEAAGVWFAPARKARDLDEARQAAHALGYPVVLKAADLEHKSDAGGVVLDLADDAALERAATDLWWRLGPGPLSVESMMPARDGVELLVGARRDPRFGAVAVVGLGGVYTEVLSDVAVALAPVDEVAAEGLIRSLRGAPLLLGTRGRPPLDIAAAATALVAISKVAAGYPAIAEIEVNPLLVCRTGAYGLDARLVLLPESSDSCVSSRGLASGSGGGG
ncbi:MAG TPA: acetate--CoA ligase family protein, partial [Acidimicrobiales bacterium]|nr:acetate--CoA ligase family protein [Acidimicrobiales bacterium]